MIFSMDYKCRAAKKKKYSSKMAFEKQNFNTNIALKKCRNGRIGRAEVEMLYVDGNSLSMICSVSLEKMLHFVLSMLS